MRARRGGKKEGRSDHPRKFGVIAGTTLIDTAAMTDDEADACAPGMNHHAITGTSASLSGTDTAMAKLGERTMSDDLAEACVPVTDCHASYGECEGTLEGNEKYLCPWQAAMAYASKEENKHRYAGLKRTDYTELPCDLSCSCERCNLITSVKMFIPDAKTMAKMSGTNDWAFDHIIKSYIVILRHEYREQLARKKMLLVPGKSLHVVVRLYSNCSGQ